jgi:hypothetical protein
MDIGTTLRGAHLLVTNGSDRLRDDLAPHVTTAVEQTASEHADELGMEFKVSDEGAFPDDVPAFVEEDALPPEESGEMVLTTLLYEALETPRFDNELDDLGDKGDAVGREILAEELEARAAADVALDFEAVAKDFCRYLERATSEDGELSRQIIIRHVQALRDELDGARDSAPTSREVLFEQGFRLLDDDAIEN